MENPKKVTIYEMPLKLEVKEGIHPESFGGKTREIFDRLNFMPNLLTELQDDLENKPMENWGKWLGVRRTLVVHELEVYIWNIEWENYCANSDLNTKNTAKPINVKHNIYAQVNIELFDKGGADYEHRLVFTFFTPNPNHKK